MRLVATDLDGTLLRSDLTVSARTVAALDALTGPVAFVTGRPVRWLAAVLDQTGPRGPVVCANGAVVYDPDTDEVLAHRPLTPDLLAEIVDDLRRELGDVVFAVEVDHGRRLCREIDYPTREESTVTDLLAEPAAKLLLRPREPGTNHVDAVVKLLGDRAVATYSSNHGLVEISAAGVTKASGLAWLAERYGTAATDTVVFGDMPNDLPMFAWAGHAVAVANAHPQVRAAADAVTLSNDDDGVAAYLGG